VIPIPQTYKLHGFTFNLLERDGNVALYEQIDGKASQGYEVVVITFAKERECFGKTMPAAEQLPNANRWGALGWTFTHRMFPRGAFRAAHTKMRELLARGRPLQENAPISSGITKEPPL